jgi:hypothetical protein
MHAKGVVSGQKRRIGCCAACGRRDRSAAGAVEDPRARVERILFARRDAARRDAGDPHARDALVERFLPLARSLALVIQISRLLHQTLPQMRHVADQQQRLAGGELRPVLTRQPDRLTVAL